MIGGLLDTCIDRFVEGGWILALGVTLLLAPPDQSATYPHWFVLIAVVGATFAMLYFRWSALQKDLYILRQELLEFRRKDLSMLHQALHDEVVPGSNDVRMLYVPFAFNRDVSIWMLAIITLTPYWLEGLALVTVLHGIRGLEMNYYTIRALQSRETQGVTGLMDPDYHK